MLKKPSINNVSRLKRNTFTYMLVNQDVVKSQKELSSADIK